MFDKNKQNAVSKLDKSKKGSLDEPLIELVKSINALPNYYTTSSCSGRIVLLELSTKKEGNNWLLSSHGPISYNQLSTVLGMIKENEVWFKMEPIIIHVCARTIDDADALLKHARSIGLKRGGIISVKPKICLELQSTEQINLLIVKDGKILVDEHYGKILVQKANGKLHETHSKITTFEQSIRKL